MYPGRPLGLTHSFAGCTLFSFRGVATVYAVKAAGLAIGIGIGSSCIVLVSFFWGIFIFHEHVHSITGACFAILALIVGILGMSYYSSPVKMEEVHGETELETNYTQENEYQLQSDPIIDGSEKVSAKEGIVRRTTRQVPSSAETISDEQDGIICQPETVAVALDNEYVWIRGIKMQKRHLGMLTAAFGGLWGGSILAVRM
jgi:hypothetical protein